MSMTTVGFVRNGVIVPNVPLPEGAQVQIQVVAGDTPQVPPASARRVTPMELRRMPRSQRQQLLATAAQAAEKDYRSDSELTGFDAYSEEELDDDDSDSR
jgi:hypothetical protein